MRALDAMGRLSLVKKIQAALLRDNCSLGMLHIEVSDQDTVYINGLTKTEENQGRLMEIVKKVPGVHAIKTELRIMPRSASEDSF